MTTSDYDPESQAERRRVLVNDARVRATTMHQHAVAEASIETGRFTQVTVAHVVGSEPAVRYPAASSSWQIQLPDEPPTGYRIDAMSEFESSMAPPVEATDDPANAPSGGSGSAPSGGQVSERAGSSPFPTDQHENQ